jgi:serine/threonine-protein kinase
VDDTDRTLTAGMAAALGPAQYADGVSLISFEMDGRWVERQMLAKASAPSELPKRFGPYVVLGMLGRGGMGAVYKARDERLNRPVAIKVGPPGQFEGAESLTRFRRETHAVARLAHPNIVAIYDVGEQDSSRYTVLELVEGGDLTARLAQGPLPPRDAAGMMVALARAVHYAHGQGIIHRDLKPSNILITPDGVPKISDFGLAKMVDYGMDQNVTVQGQFLGTPRYMSPEQVQGRHDRIGPAADIFALGVIFYEMLTGRRPFEGASVVEVLNQVLTRDPEPPSRINGTVPRELDTVALRCLSKVPEKRYASAGDLADDLERFLAEPPPPAQARLSRPSLWRRLRGT